MPQSTLTPPPDMAGMKLSTFLNSCRISISNFAEGHLEFGSGVTELYHIVTQLPSLAKLMGQSMRC